MNSLRPLFTISVLVIVGGYLYLKINEGPAHPQVGAHGVAESDGVPPLAAVPGGAKLDRDTSAPAWPPAANDAPPAPTLPPGINSPANATATAEGSKVDTAANKNGVPEVPPIPELPELPKTADASPATVMPAVPQASNVDGPNLGATTETPVALPVLPGDPNGSNVAGTPPTANTPSANVDAANSTLPIGGEAAAPPAAGAATTPAAPPAAGAPPIPAVPVGANASAAPPPATAAPSANDRYNVSADTTPAQTPITPLPNAQAAAVPGALPPNAATSTSTFAASWPTIQAALDQNDLKQAHQLLSKWHNNETLTPEESQKVEGLLGQLAGTVIYSNEHRLEPARVVKPGESLETIAKEYNVPWQLLAKINSIAAPDQLRPGQELKVVRGPFTAVLDVRRNELTLEVDGRYAGTFPVTIPPGAPVTDGQWVVEQKAAGQQNGVAPASYTSPPAAAIHSILLRSANATGPQQGPTLVIASGVASTPNAGATIQVGPQDAEDLSDILSIGSRVVVRR